MVKKCGECQRTFNGCVWDWQYDLAESAVVYTHGYCPSCFDDAMARFEAMFSSAAAMEKVVE